MNYRILLTLIAYVLPSFAAKAQDHGGIAVGIQATAEPEMGWEADYLSRIDATNEPKSFSLWRASVGGNFWQSKQRGVDGHIEGGYCRGFRWHVCAGIGLRKNNSDVMSLQTSLEAGSGFLFAIFLRPLVRLSQSDNAPPKNKMDTIELELGVKFKWPVWTF